MKLISIALRSACAATILTAVSNCIPVSLAQTRSDNPSRASKSGGTPPSCHRCPDPNFPVEALQAKITSAVVVLDIRILADGKTDDIRVVSDPGHGLADSAVKTVAKWQFNPAKNKDGEGVSVRVKVEVSFRSQRRP